VCVSSHDLFRVLFVNMCFSHHSTLIFVQTNTSVTRLCFNDDFVLDKPNKWMSMALQVRNLYC